MLVTTYNILQPMFALQPGPAEQMEDLWPELGHPSMHKRAQANQRRSQAPQLVCHSSGRLATLQKGGTTKP